MSARRKGILDDILDVVFKAIFGLLGLLFHALWRGAKSLFFSRQNRLVHTPPPIPIQKETGNSHAELDRICLHASDMARSGDFSGGCRLLQDALRTHPNSGLLNFALGSLHLESAIGVKGTRMKELQTLAAAAQLRQRWQSKDWLAIPSFQRAAELEPSNEMYRRYLGHAWSALTTALDTLEDWENADLAYWQHSRIAPQTAKKYAIYSLRAASGMQRIIESSRAGGGVVVDAEARAERILQRAEHALSAGDFGTASPRFQAAIVLKPDSVAAYLGHAQCVLEAFHYAIEQDGVPTDEASRREALEFLSKAAADMVKVKEISPTEARVVEIEGKLHSAHLLVT